MTNPTLAHVLSADILDVARRPTLTFHSASIGALDAGPYAIVGQLTIGEVTQPVTLQAELGGIETSVDGSRRAGLGAVGQLNRRDFGIGPDIPGAMLGDVVKIELDVQLIEPQSSEVSR